MSENFTPGPLYLGYSECDDEGPLREAEFTGEIFNTEGRCVGKVYDEKIAKFMVSAYEMYKTLECISYTTRVGRRVDAWTLQSFVKDADAVLKKARGES